MPCCIAIPVVPHSHLPSPDTRLFHLAYPAVQSLEIGGSKFSTQFARRRQGVESGAFPIVSSFFAFDGEPPAVGSIDHPRSYSGSDGGRLLDRAVDGLYGHLRAVQDALCGCCLRVNFTDGFRAASSEAFDPPRQAAIPGRGYPVFKVECDGFTFEFSSLAEMRVCIEILSQKLLPRTIDLARERGSAKGPNSHWLSRLPGRVKSWRYREKAVAYLCEALKAFAQDIA